MRHTAPESEERQASSALLSFSSSMASLLFILLKVATSAAVKKTDQRGFDHAAPEICILPKTLHFEHDTDRASYFYVSEEHICPWSKTNTVICWNPLILWIPTCTQPVSDVRDLFWTNGGDILLKESNCRILWRNFSVSYLSSRLQLASLNHMLGGRGGSWWETTPGHQCVWLSS